HTSILPETEPLVLLSQARGSVFLSAYCHSPFLGETKKTRRFIGKYSTEFSQIAALWTKSKDYAHS
ncbi:MAG: hypothetical protein RSD95_02045, partial [Clostridia bacterium]